MEHLYSSYKPLLFSLAYRMLGSVMDAEDIVQEAFLALNRSGMEHVQNIKAYLCKVVTNRCLEFLRSAKNHREVYTGTWLPEPFVTADESDPMQAYLQKESLSTAYLLLLQQLSHVERAVFLLREALQYDYEEIAAIVGKSSTNCRQIFHRAKRSLSKKDGAEPVDRLESEQATGLVKQFMQALATGNAAQIMKHLSEDAVLFTDGGGKVNTLPHPLQGPIRISNLLAAFLKNVSSRYAGRIAMVNGQPGLVVYLADKVQAVISFKIANGRIVHLYIVVNPDKLAHVQN